MRLSTFLKNKQRARKLRKCSWALAFLLLYCSPAGAVTTTWYTQVGGSANLTNQAFTSATKDTSGVKVTSKGVLVLSNSTISTTGATSSEDNSNFYGINAGVLATSGSNMTLTGCNIKTTGSGANGVFSTGSGTSVTLVNDTIYCSGSSGHGVDATVAGSMNLTNVIITTESVHAAAYATDRGGGTIVATGGSATTNGTDSPCIYSTGSITVSDATINATASEAVVIEGANSATMNNCIVSAGKGSRNRANLIYQSMSGDAEGKQGVLTINGGTFNWTQSGPAFYITNTIGIIKLSGAAINNSSDTLIKASADSWGTSGSNGGTVQFTAINETMIGGMYCDAISSIEATFKTGTIYTGAINKAALAMDETSYWHVSGTSYLTTFTDATPMIIGDSIINIYGNGNCVYYDSTLSGNSYLGKKTYSLNGGGYLTAGLCSKSTAVNETNSESEPTIFPNPASATLNIKSNSDRPQEYSIFNIYGQKLAEGAVSGEQIINLSSWPSGVYFVQINSQFKRIVVTK